MKTHKCPRCATDMTPRDTAQKIGTPLGMTVALASRFLAKTSGDPAATMAALLAGAVAGQKLGELLDDHVIKNYRCSNCGCEISL